MLSEIDPGTHGEVEEDKMAVTATEWSIVLLFIITTCALCLVCFFAIFIVRRKKRNQRAARLRRRREARPAGGAVPVEGGDPAARIAEKIKTVD